MFLIVSLRACEKADHFTGSWTVLAPLPINGPNSVGLDVRKRQIKLELLYRTEDIGVYVCEQHRLRCENEFVGLIDEDALEGQVFERPFPRQPRGH